MPEPVATRLTTEINAALTTPEVREKLLQQGWEVMAKGGDALAKRVTESSAVWGAVIRQANIRGQ